MRQVPNNNIMFSATKKVLAGLAASLFLSSFASASTNYFEDFSNWKDLQPLIGSNGWTGTTDNVARVQNIGGKLVAATRSETQLLLPAVDWTPGNSGEVLTFECDMSISPDISGANVTVGDVSKSGSTQFAFDSNIYQEARAVGADTENGFHYAVVADSGTGIARYYVNGVLVNKTQSTPGNQWFLHSFAIETAGSDDGYFTFDNIHIAAAAQKLQLALSSNYFREGDTVQAQLTLPAPAPKGGLTLNIKPSNNAVKVPATVTVAEGQTQVIFPVLANATEANLPFTLTATNGNLTAKASATTRSTTLQSFRLASYTVKGGSSTTGTLTLEAAALAGGKTLTVSVSDGSIATAPKSVTIPAGSTSASFNLSFAKVKSKSSVTIKVTCGDRSSQVVVSVQ